MKCHLSLHDFLEAGFKLHFSDHLSLSAWDICRKTFKWTRRPAKDEEEEKGKELLNELKRRSRGKKKRKDGFSSSMTYNATVLSFCLYYSSRREENATTVKEICQATGAGEKSVWQMIRKKDAFLSAHPITSQQLFQKYAVIFELSVKERAEWSSMLSKVKHMCSSYSPETVCSYIFYSLLKNRKGTERKAFSARQVTKVIGGSTTCLFRLAKIIKSRGHVFAESTGRRKR